MHRVLASLLAAASAVPLALANPSADATYDYIVVGSGPGGGPLACDLARAGYSTLLVEAGSDMGNDEIYSVMSNFNTAGNDEDSRWDFWVKHSSNDTREKEFAHYTYRQANGDFYVGTNPPKDAVALGIQYPRAGTLGGCAMHNGGVCSLPQDEDWNIIVEKTGDASWEASKMRKYLKEVEKNEYLPAGNKDHGYDGWLAVTAADNSWSADGTNAAGKIIRKLAQLINPSDNVTTMSDAAFSAYANTDILGNYDQKDTISSLYSMVSHADSSGNRSSPNNYIKATLADPAKYPLTVRTETLVTKVLFNTTGAVPQAIGVEVMTGKSMYKADPRHKAGAKGPVSSIWAAKEVIVSGGAFNSPQILKLSGIGPAAELKKFGIPVVKDLPGVGTNLADNYEGGLLALSNKAPVGGGLITAIFRTPNAPTKNRNIWTWCGAFSFEGFWPGFPEYYGEREYECAMVHMSPKSQHGQVLLTSADPQDTPDINFGFFSEDTASGAKGAQADLDELAAGADLLRQAWLAADDPNVLPFSEMHPCAGTSGGKDCTLKQEAEVVKTQAYSHHASSTCAIGSDSDPMAVLDSKFKVRGVKGLRVVDASIFPRVPGAFPVLPTIMISRKAQEVIIADAKAMVA